MANAINMDRPLVQKKAMLKRVKLPNGDTAKGTMDARGTFSPDERLVMNVFMYQDEPGVYYDQHGRKLPNAVAASQGFDVKRMAKLAEKHAQDVALKASMQETIEERMHEVIETMGDYKLVQIADDAYTVEGPGDEHLLEPNSEEVARQFMAMMAGEFEMPEEPVMAFEDGTFKKETEDAPSPGKKGG